MEARGRGRGYGRARGTPAGAQQQPAQPRPGQQPGGQPQAGTAGQQGAWGIRPQTAPQAAWPRAQVRPQAPPQRQQPAEPTPSGVVGKVSGAGDAEVQAPGSSVRGRVVNRSTILFTRPKTLETKKGTSGAPIKLSANYLELNQEKDNRWCLFQYRVDFSPDIDQTKVRRILFRTAVKDIMVNTGYVFDGTVFFTPVKLNPDPLELFVEAEDGEKVRITIRLVGDLAWGDYHYIQVFNIIIRKCLQLLELTQVGRNYYLPSKKINFEEHKIQLWPGYFTSIRQYENKICLNVDLSFKFMRTDTVYDLLMECNPRNTIKEFQSKIIGTVVLTSYNNKTYRIDDVSFETTPTSTFEKKNGGSITYAEYFKTKYNVNIRDLKQPMLISNSKPREIRMGMPEIVRLVPELCQMTGLTDRQRDNFQLMKQLDGHTKVAPEGRIAKLVQFAQEIHSKPKVLAEIKNWDLQVAKRLLEFNGRVLPQEKILGGNSQHYLSGEKVEWSRDLRAKPMFAAGEMKRLAIICPNRFKNATQDFVGKLKQAAQGMRWTLGGCDIFEISDDRPAAYLDAVERVIQQCQPTLVLVVLSTNSADRYAAIKKKCCIEKGIPTQMVVARNLTSKNAMTIATKVVIQMNCKIGGAPWSVVMPLPGLMVVGYDVCRDTVKKSKSFAGMVASLDRQLTRYHSSVYMHECEEELSDYCASFLILACKKYKQVNGTYPDKILIYRDGVGEGQLPYVYEHEVVMIKKRLKDEVYAGAEVKMAFIVVSKRINAKIFHGKANPPSGTVVDDVITLPERYDFYLVSQCVREGTVAPTSYNVLEDTLGLPADRLQILTYKLCHVFYNWSGTIRVPAPTQYAHKLAFFTSQTLHRSAHPDLQELLFFI